MSFHPDANLPACMMPDGGECCAGHAAVCEDWHKQRREIEKLRRDVDNFGHGMTSTNDRLVAALEENERLRNQLVSARAALKKIADLGWDDDDPEYEIARAALSSA